MTVYTSPFAPFSDITNLSIPQFMTRYNPDGVPTDKVVHMDSFTSEHLTYGSLREKASRAAWGLRYRLGVRQGDAVLAIVTNSNDFVLLAHATWWAGGVFAPLNTSSTQKDIEHVLNLVKPTHIATITSKLTDVRNAISTLGIAPKVFTVLGKASDLPQFPTDITGTDPKTQTLPPFDLDGKSARETPSTICFSSGTTGNMKGVLMSHYNLVNNLMQMRVSLPSRLISGVREVWFTPYCHIYGLAAVVISGMWTGATFIGLPSFDLETFCRKSSELQATDMHLVPPVALLLTTSDIAQKYDVPSVERIVIAAAPLKQALQRELKKRFPKASICQGYGLTECSPSVSHQIDDKTSGPGTVGKLVAGTEARLVDPTTGRDVDPGEEGELWIRGPQVMMGYINNPEATAATISNGWLRTGDILRMDKDQNLWVTDRLKEMIKYKGFQIAPSELEDLLLRHSHVADAAICATYDDAQATEVPLAYVSLTPEKAILPPTEIQKILEEIQKWADGQLAGYKRLRGGVFHLQTLPKTPTGKILRRLLPAKVREGRGGRL
ncbi:hypothetical protein BJX63DRAFT_444603 [Aspergillus granulosus]|uniref:Uncharacterized protein n=1 Tax=Aspergillus granulosus TaxID=176169 RepID=A0ABR4HY71_9EURO